MLGLGTEEVDGGGAASGDEAEELGAEEFAATPVVVAHLESRRRSWARRSSPAVATHLDSGVEVEEKLDRGRWESAAQAAAPVADEPSARQISLACCGWSRARASSTATSRAN